MARKIEVSSRTIIFTVVFLLSLRFIWELRDLILGLFLSFILMSALKPIVNRLSKTRLPRSVAAFIVVFTSLVTIVTLLTILIPPIISETILFLTNLPVFLQESVPFLSGYLNPESTVQFLPNLTENALRVATGFLSNFLFLISVFFFTFYFLLEEQFLSSFLNRFLDKKTSRQILVFMHKVEGRMGAWMRGELILMTVIGVMTYVFLKVLGVPFALSLAFLAGLMEIIPIIGPIVSAVPAFIVAASDSFLLGGTTLVVYVVIQQLENNLIVPYIMNKAVGIHPITTLIALSIGGRFGGMLGAILAVPLALLIESAVSEYSKQK